MSRTVILIDDSKFLLKQLSEFFEKVLNFKVIEMGYDGNMAVELYRKYRPDLITLDITMPNKNGSQALREILDEFPDAKVLMISAVRGNAMLECMSNGAGGYIEKPLKFNSSDFVDDFKQTIKEILGFDE